VPVVVRRGDVELTRIVRPDARTKYEIGEIGVVPDYHPQVRAVSPGKPAERAGIRPGDVILAIDGQPLVRDNQLTDTINKSAGKELTLTILRDGVKRDIQVVPAKEGDVGLIGITIRPWEFRIEKPGPIRAVWMSLERSYDLSVQIFQTLGGLITRETSPKQLIGPLGIAQASGGAAAAGFDRLIELMAVISLNLGLLNLLPIPVLDGGHIFIMAVEGLVKREFSVRVKEQMFTVGLVLLMMLMVTVIYNDLMRISWIENLVPWR
ncbi:MAG: RIP metalloprotease RseP, partial [Acidimicrobiia bacterium]